jgi:hypothetical protein
VDIAEASIDRAGGRLSGAFPGIAAGCVAANALQPAWRPLFAANRNAPIQDGVPEAHTAAFVSSGFGFSFKRSEGNGGVPAGKERAYSPQCAGVFDCSNRDKPFLRRRFPAGAA